MEYEFLKAAAGAALATASPGVLSADILRFSIELKEAAGERERVVAKLKELLPTGAYEVFNPLEDDPRVLVLQFPGVPISQSPEFLFRVSQWLVGQLDVDAVNPNFNPGWGTEGPAEGEQTEGVVRGIVSALCEADGADPANKRWSIEQVKVPQAWAKFNVSGDSVRVGQPDTGVADHDELVGALDIASGANFIDGTGLPIDPLAKSMGNPGHGTATSSVVASRNSGAISGTAPGATVVPIRCVDTVVIGDGVAVAKAIDHARSQQCQIVTMSLGGPIAGSELKRAIDRAVQANMIVLAAAGNCVGFVVFPASYKNVIAVAGTNIKGKKWKGSSVGRKVDVSAPAERVIVARRNSPQDPTRSEVKGGQGTSFAVTTVAGIAALWIERFTHAAIVAEATQRGTTVQELFRTALKQTATPPDVPFDTKKQGAGIANALALLELPLHAIGNVGSPPSSEYAYGDVLAPPDADPDSGDLPTRYGTEATYLAFDRSLRQSPVTARSLETIAVPVPSDGLASIIASAKPSTRTRFGAPKSGLLTPPLPPLSRREQTILSSLQPTGKVLESSTLSIEAAADFLGSGGIEEITSGLTDIFSKSEVSINQEAVGMVIDSASSALRTIQSKGMGALSSLSQKEQIGLEAVIRLRGRPALPIKDGKVDAKLESMGDWGVSLAGGANELRPALLAVGRIDVLVGNTWQHVGTGTLVKGGIVVTNRHVIEAFTELFPGSKTPTITREAAITFEDQPHSQSVRFPLDSVLSAGRVPIGRSASAAKLDLALLKVTIRGAAAAPQPAAVGPLPGQANAAPNYVFVVGYPAPPDRNASLDPQTQKQSVELLRAIFEAFGQRYGQKLISPGLIISQPGMLAGDVRSWTFAHDASTLPGHSGSSVLAWQAADTGPPSVAVSGFHFAGAPLRLNMAHSLDAVRREAQKDPSWINLHGL